MVYKKKLYSWCCFLSGGKLKLWVKSLNFHFENESKDAANHDLALEQTKNLNKEKRNIPSDGQHSQSVLNEAVRKNLQNLFNNVYSLLKEGKPFTEYKYQVKLDKAKGVGIGKTYLIWAGVVQFTKRVNYNFMVEFAKEFNEAKFFSLMLDESLFFSLYNEIDICSA